MVDGYPVLLEGKITTADEQSVIRTCQAQAEELTKRAGIDTKKRSWKSLAF
jgi:hypothetical protein